MAAIRNKSLLLLLLFLVITEKMLTFWKPTSETICLLHEGHRFHIFHLMARYVRWVECRCTMGDFKFTQL